jgi:two-component system response regulator AtoC
MMDMQKPHLLIVDDEKHTRMGLEAMLEPAYQVFLARNGKEGIQLMEEHPFDLILTDLRMAEASGIDVVKAALQLPEPPACIVMTAYGDIETAVAAMRAGAVDFITKPLHFDNLEIALKRALENRSLKQENEALHRRLDDAYHFQGLVGQSAAFKRLLDQLKQVAPSKATILLQGPTGTGKELAAQLIHQNSPRSRQPLITVHCAALPQNLLESELFGYEKGAFTGATERRKGRFEAADKGTLFLDEIGEIDAPTQVKLLRFLESRSFERLGSVQPITVDVRLIVATHRDLKALVRQGSFREDLYYRLSTVPILIPSLRERAEDIPLLVDHYLKHFAAENQLPVPQLLTEAKVQLFKYPWPGNIRELKNVCENLVVLHAGKKVRSEDLPLVDSAAGGGADVLATAGQAIEEEKARILSAIKAADGNKSKAAELLNMSRRTLYRKLDS